MHISVLSDEVITVLNPQKGDSVLDVTLGLGGHSKLFLEAVGTKGTVTGIDADATNLEAANTDLSQYKNFTAHHSNFRFIQELDIGTFDVIFADLGLSSPQIDNPERGFTFRKEAPLDLRFNQSDGIPASRFIAERSEEDLADAFYHFGEIRQSRKLAALCKKFKPKTTTHMVRTSEKLFGDRVKSFLPQIFQALRIAVNDELTSLATLLQVAPHMLNPGGRFGVISFHSLEDRMVKQAFRSLASPIRDDFTGSITHEPDFSLLTKKPIKPSDSEVQENPRSRSALLRALKRVE